VTWWFARRSPCLTCAVRTKAPRGGLGSALRKLLDVSGLKRQQVDGLCMSSFTLAPDGLAPFVQYVGLSPRFLEFLPTGGACGIMALHRAARAVQCGDAEVVACVAGDTNGTETFHDLVAQFSTFSRDCVLAIRRGRTEPELRIAD